MMMLTSIAFIAAYILGTGALMYVNTTWFALGDVKFGRDGWQLYGPLWAVFYSPVAVSALVVIAKARRPIEDAPALPWVFLLAILAAMEVSFVPDANLVVLVTEWVALTVVFCVARDWWLPPDAPRGFEVVTRHAPPSPAASAENEPPFPK